MKVSLFFLLVFLVLSSLAMTKINSLPVVAPRVSVTHEVTKQDMTLTIRGDGAIYLNKTATTLKALGPLLAREMHKHPQGIVVVKADASANYALVVKAMNEARQIGIRQFALASDD